MSCEYRVNAYDENFDFFKSRLPENHFLFAFGDQLKRARLILDNRSKEEIEYIIESLDWMLRESSQLEFESSMHRLETEEGVFINRVKAFKLFSEKYDITNQTNLPNASWADYFATLSLITILEAIHPENYEYSLSSLDFPLEALEAVCIAEFHREMEESESLSAKRKGQTGGKRKASKYGEIINKVLSVYRDTPGLSDLSNRKAGYLLSEMLKDEIQSSPLDTEEPEHRIEIWLGKYKNGKLKITE